MLPETRDLTLTFRGGSLDIAVVGGDFSHLGGRTKATALTPEIETLRTDVLIRLMTTPGEWLGNPNVGAGISEMVGSPVTERNITRLYEQIVRSLTADLRIPQGDLDLRMQQIDATSFRIQVLVRVSGDLIDLVPDYVMDFSSGLRGVGIQTVS